jgi:hypothetical protein
MQRSTRAKGPLNHANAWRYGDLTVEQARAMRADQARLAALYADRVEQTRAAAQPSAMRHWLEAYRRSASRCRLLGERIRSEHATSTPPVTTAVMWMTLSITTRVAP